MDHARFFFHDGASRSNVPGSGAGVAGRAASVAGSCARPAAGNLSVPVGRRSGPVGCVACIQGVCEGVFSRALNSATKKRSASRPAPFARPCLFSGRCSGRVISVKPSWHGCSQTPCPNQRRRREFEKYILLLQMVLCRPAKQPPSEFRLFPPLSPSVSAHALHACGTWSRCPTMTLRPQWSTPARRA